MHSAVESSTDHIPKELDSETGLYYYRARYYDPQTGRFLGQDPIGFNGGTNFYASSYNNAIASKDPFGTCTITLYFEHTGKHADGTLYHSFLTLKNPGNNGNTFVFRGGPSANGAPPPQVIVSAELDRLGVSPDAPNEAVYSIKLLDNDCSCAPFFENLYDYERRVDQRKVPYGWTHNSNSVTSDALGVLGLAAPSIPWWIGPLLPGWGNSLLPGTGGGGGGW